ncbi:Thermoresistant gluconokinase [Hartmannibacter diazotrophicus]|uniref:Gluconokinase n=1 Tax=Hartmannibacter diazotrophicus TaxID=1482074 RepID=A0A2C9D626_9HYPH|nr:gluconokinase [Hartmannibacter diazotrophicus]SON54975.1 Thermoresistant gluconokinase [Hartmannibacter diazotrophicus]
MASEVSSVLVMGVCGVGKTTLAQSIADALHCGVVEADDFHPKQNVDAMRAGQPLNDDMRWSWLDALGNVVAGTMEADPSRPVVFACSALKRSYRERLREKLGRFAIVHLTGSPDLIHERMTGRKDHFMPTSLLASQLADLEPPTEDEAPLIRIDVGQTQQEMTAEAISFVTPLIGNGDERR